MWVLGAFLGKMTNLMTNLNPLKHYINPHLPLTNDKLGEDTMSASKYDALKGEYPDYISKDQLRKICGISPLSATYLIKNGIIPVIDTGKKTWRYRISIDDVIVYLQERENRGSMIPIGAATSTDKNVKVSAKSFASLINQGMEKQVRSYFAYISEDYPDVISVSDIADISGMCKKTILLHIKLGYIKHLKKGSGYMIPKEYALDYLCGPKYINAKHSTKYFERILGGFQIWLNARS
jgi:hypothetical protein